MPFGNSKWPQIVGKMQPRWGRSWLGHLPRVAPSSQPWAERWNPFGIQAWNFRKALGLGLIAGLCLGLTVLHGAAQDQTSEFELIQDNHFHRGFILWQPQPGQHVRYGELPGFDTSAKPVWGLAQWTSKFPLAAATRVATPDGSLVCTNSAKGVILGPAGTPAADVSLSANSRVEYGATARKSGDPWVHLLAEQEFGPSAPLAQLKAAKLHVEARLSYAHNLHQNDYQPSVHAGCRTNL